MAKYFFYLFLVFALIFGLEFFRIVDVPYLEIPDWISGAEENLTKGLRDADKVD